MWTVAPSWTSEARRSAIERLDALDAELLEEVRRDAQEAGFHGDLEGPRGAQLIEQAVSAQPDGLALTVSDADLFRAPIQKALDEAKSRVDAITTFPEEYPGSKVIKLEENFRSTQPILNLANEIIQGATEKYSKHLFTRKLDGPLPALVQAAGAHDRRVAYADVLAHRYGGRIDRCC